ncbi:hypothetical protein KY289_005959 [Solanum tuberosum]|nr:hypothetical protein KY289_005959 [Solanum tuberosum]
MQMTETPRGNLLALTKDLESSSSPHTVPTFTPDQYNHLLKLIDKDSSTQKSVANMADNDTTPWIVDTGATDHMDLCNGKVRRIGKERGGLYMLPSTKKTSPPSPATAFHSSTHTQSFSSTSIDIWHLRLGHAPIAVLHKIESLKLSLQNKP